MSKKIKVFLEAEPNTEIIIKPIAAELSNPVQENNCENEEKMKLSLSPTGTVTGIPGGGDVDVDVEW